MATSPRSRLSVFPVRLDGLTSAFASPWTSVALALGAAVLAAAIQHLVYPGLSWNRDEPVYLWQVELMLQGRLTGADGGFAELFHPWLSAWREGEFFTQYPLGWPLVMLPGVALGWPGAAISIAAALAVSGVVALALEVTRDRLVANAAGLVLLCSPIFAVQAGVYLNYLFTLGLGLWFVALLLGSVRLDSTSRAVTAALAFGWIVSTRSYDAVLWGSVAVGYLAVVEWGRWREHLRIAAWFLAVLTPFVVLLLLHNRALTGSPFAFPILEKDHLDTFGFGDRRLMPALEVEAYGPRRALLATAKHGFFLPWFLVGAYLGAAVAVAAAWFGRRDRTTWLLLALIAAFPIGYFPFWGTYVSSLTVRLNGPIYLIPLYGPLAILIAAGLVALARRSPRWTGALLVALLVITVPVTVGRLGINRELSRAQLAWAESVETIDEPTIVVTTGSTYLLFLNPFSDNSPEIDGDIIYAANVSPRVIELLDAHPDRRHVLQRATAPPIALLPSERPTQHEVVLDPLELVSGSLIEVTVHIIPPSDGESVWAVVNGDGVSTRRLVTDRSEAGEALTVSWILRGPDGASSDTGESITLPEGLLTLEFGASFGEEPTGTPFVFHRFHLRAGERVEILVPGTSFRAHEVEDFPDPVRWDELLSTPELTVEVESPPTGGGRVDP